jgi:hypothetical protein
MLYGTYLGGSGSDCAFGLVVDDSGHAYVVGRTYSTDFPTQNPYQMDQDTLDAFVAKLSASGNSLVYATYLGGNNMDYAYALAVDTLGHAYVAGWTWSTDFPTQNPFQTDQDTVDAFVVKLSVAGDSLVYGTYLGGDGEEKAYGIAVDASGNAYVAGETYSTDFPTQNPYQTDQDTVDAFVTKLNAAGDGLVYGTYLGGSNRDLAFGVATDVSGNAYVTGYTESSDFPTENPLQTVQGGEDGILVKLSAAGDSLVYSTYLGGVHNDIALALAVNDSGNAYVAGQTESTDFPTENPYQTHQGSRDAFVMKLSAAGDSLLYGTFLGGSGIDNGRAVAVDDSGNIYAAVMTYSTDFPTRNPIQTDQVGWDACVVKLSAAGDSLLYGTYLGGNDTDWPYALAADAAGNAYVAGLTYSTDFPTENPCQTDQGGQDAFIVKLSGGPVDCPVAMTGDVNTDSVLTAADVIYLVNYAFKSGLEPQPCPAAGDVNCDGAVTAQDILLLVIHVFKSGPPPCDACAESPLAGDC